MIYIVLLSIGHFVTCITSVLKLYNCFVYVALQAFTFVLNFDPCICGWFYVSSLLSTLVTFAFPHTIGQFSPASGKTFHACAHVGITVTTYNVEGSGISMVSILLDSFTWKILTH